MAGGVTASGPSLFGVNMTTSNLIDPAVARHVVTMVHNHAATSIRGLPHQRPCVLQLCSMAPDDRRFLTSAYSIGDADHMTADALVDADAGKNVFIEPRLVRPTK